MKSLIRGIAFLLVCLLLLSTVACGGGKNKDTTRDTGSSGTTRPMDPLNPTDTTRPNNGTDTTHGDTTGGDNTRLDNAAELLAEAIEKTVTVPNVREGEITSSATLDGNTSESVTSVRLARVGKDFVCHTDSTGADGSTVTVVGNTAYVQIGNMLKEKTTFRGGQYERVLYTSSMSVLDALNADSFLEIDGTRKEDGTAVIVCRGVSSADAGKLEKVLNTVNVDITEIAESFVSTFVLDADGRILSEHDELSTAVGHAVRDANNHMVEIRLNVNMAYSYPAELEITAPADADSYTEVSFRELFGPSFTAEGLSLVPNENNTIVLSNKPYILCDQMDYLRLYADTHYDGVKAEMDAFVFAIENGAGKVVSVVGYHDYEKDTYHVIEATNLPKSIQEGFAYRMTGTFQITENDSNAENPYKITFVIETAEALPLDVMQDM